MTTSNRNAPGFFPGGSPGRQQGASTTDLRVVSGTVTGENLILTLSNSSTVTISLTSVFTANQISGATFNDSTNTLTINQQGRSTSVVIPVGDSDGSDTFVQSGSYSTTTQLLTLTRNDGQGVDIDLSALEEGIINDMNTFLSSGTVTGDDLVFTLSSGATVTVDVSGLVNTNTTIGDIDGLQGELDGKQASITTAADIPQVIQDEIDAVNAADDNDDITGVIEVSGDVSSFTSSAEFTGSTPGTAGAAGIVPAPVAGESGRYLRADGTWDPIREVPTGGTDGQVLKWDSGSAAWENDPTPAITVSGTSTIDPLTDAIADNVRDALDLYTEAEVDALVDAKQDTLTVIVGSSGATWSPTDAELDLRSIMGGGGGSTINYDRQDDTVDASDPFVWVHPDGDHWSPNVTLFRNGVGPLPTDSYTISGEELTFGEAIRPGAGETVCFTANNAITATGADVSDAQIRDAFNNAPDNSFDQDKIDWQGNFAALDTATDPVFTDTQLTDAEVVTAAETNANIAALTGATDPVFTDTQYELTATTTALQVRFKDSSAADADDQLVTLVAPEVGDALPEYPMDETGQRYLTRTDTADSEAWTALPSIPDVPSAPAALMNRQVQYNLNVPVDGLGAPSWVEALDEGDPKYALAVHRLVTFQHIIDGAEREFSGSIQPRIITLESGTANFITFQNNGATATVTSSFFSDDVEVGDYVIAKSSSEDSQVVGIVTAVDTTLNTVDIQFLNYWLDNNEFLLGEASTPTITLTSTFMGATNIFIAELGDVSGGVQFTYETGGIVDANVQADHVTFLGPNSTRADVECKDLLLSENGGAGTSSSISASSNTGVTEGEIEFVTSGATREVRVRHNSTGTSRRIATVGTAGTVTSYEVQQVRGTGESDALVQTGPVDIAIGMQDAFDRGTVNRLFQVWPSSVPAGNDVFVVTNGDVVLNEETLFERTGGVIRVTNSDTLPTAPRPHAHAGWTVLLEGDNIAGAYPETFGTAFNLDENDLYGESGGLYRWNAGFSLNIHNQTTLDDNRPVTGTHASRWTTIIAPAIDDDVALPTVGGTYQLNVDATDPDNIQYSYTAAPGALIFVADNDGLPANPATGQQIHVTATGVSIPAVVEVLTYSAQGPDGAYNPGASGWTEPVAGDPVLFASFSTNPTGSDTTGTTDVSNFAATVWNTQMNFLDSTDAGPNTGIGRYAVSTDGGTTQISLNGANNVIHYRTAPDADWRLYGTTQDSSANGHEGRIRINPDSDPVALARAQLCQPGHEMGLETTPQFDFAENTTYTWNGATGLWVAT